MVSTTGTEYQQETTITTRIQGHQQSQITITITCEIINKQQNILDYAFVVCVVCLFVCSFVYLFVSCVLFVECCLLLLLLFVVCLFFVVCYGLRAFVVWLVGGLVS